MVNAFALPGGRILVTDKLIAMTQTPDELAAVLAHEVAHVEKRHVMQSVWRSMAAGLLLEAALGGGSGAGQQAVLLLSQLQTEKFSRGLEAEADARGLELLRSEGYSTLGMAAFFDKISDPKQAGPQLEWLSSHPDTAKRAAQARSRGRPGRPILTPQDWTLLKTVCAAPAKP
jgi:predicted Zn-dependent protease